MEPNSNFDQSGALALCFACLGFGLEFGQPTPHCCKRLFTAKTLPKLKIWVSLLFNSSNSAIFKIQL
jgi:hypothetical protein